MNFLVEGCLPRAQDFSLPIQLSLCKHLLLRILRSPTGQRVGAVMDDEYGKKSPHISPHISTWVGADSWENNLHCIICHNLQKAVKAIPRGKCIAFITKRKDENK